MAEKLWKFLFDKEDETEPFVVLNKYAKLLGEDTDNLFKGEVMFDISQDGFVDYKLYVAAMTYSYHHYMVFRVTQQQIGSKYPVTLMHYPTKDSSFHVTCADEAELATELERLIQTEETAKVLGHLKGLGDIYQRSQQ